MRRVRWPCIRPIGDGGHARLSAATRERRALLTRGRPSRNETRRARKSARCEPLEWLRRLPESDGGRSRCWLWLTCPNAPIQQDSALHFGGVIRGNDGDHVPRISRLGGKRTSRFQEGGWQEPTLRRAATFPKRWYFGNLPEYLVALGAMPRINAKLRLVCYNDVCARLYPHWPVWLPWFLSGFYSPQRLRFTTK